MDEFTRHCIELLAPLGTVRSRRMFGGMGFYVNDLFMALSFGDELYLKADDTSRARFEAAGCEPFRYDKQGGESVSISYFRPPEEAMESSAFMLPWARLGMEAAVRARSKPAKAKKSSRSTGRP